MKIRPATKDDAGLVRGVHLSAFPEGENEIIAKLAVDLLFEETVAPIVSLLAELDGGVVGHVAFSPVTTYDTREVLGYILAPLAVSPDYHRRGIGSLLVGSGIEQLSEVVSGILLVYGDPMYYGRFGFRADAAESYTPPYELQYSFGWQGIGLGDFGKRGSSVRISCVPSLGNPALW